MKKTASLNIRIDESQRGVLQAAADAAHESMSEFVRRSSLQSADNVLADRRRFAISDAAWEAYERALDAPAEIKPELVELFSEPDIFA
jgi:uncharacterized protein (DUF1778 family)